ncbi:MAG: NAD-dependent epimerase/dehydratase family protein [Pseudomonadota bacterium]
MTRSPLLITGATGRIGGALLSALLARGEACRALVRDPARARLPAEVEVVAGALDDAATSAQAVAGVGSVMHLAADTEDGTVTDAALVARLRRANVAGTRALAQAAAAAGVARFLCVSSAAVYGAQAGERIDEDTLPAPDSSYGVSKLLAEEAALEAGRAGGMAVTVARPVLVACPPSGRRDALGVLLRLARRGLLPVPRGAGPCRKAIVSLDEVVQGLLAARGLDGGILLLSGARTYPLEEIAAAFGRLLGRRAGLSVPVALLRAGGALPIDPTRVAKYLADERFDAARSRALLGLPAEGPVLEDVLRPCLG